MNIAAIQYTLKTLSLEIYVSGCSATPKCEGCHNPELWDFGSGFVFEPTPFTVRLSNYFQEWPNMIDNIMIMGGEPLDQNLDQFMKMILVLKNFNVKLWLFTRYELEHIPLNLVKHFDYIKTGKYDPEQLTDKNFCHGIQLSTKNQKIFKKGVDF